MKRRDMSLVKATGPTTVEVLSQDDEKTVLKVLCTTNGGPEKKDLHGEFFTPNTFFGDNLVTQKFGTYDHMMNPTLNPYAPDDVETQILGKAELIEADDMGRWFRFEVARKNQYHDYIMRLNDMKALGASTQCLPGGKRKNAETGEIEAWAEVEVCLTVAPADSDTVGKVEEMAKSLGLKPPVLVKSEESSADEPGTEVEQTAPVDEQVEQSEDQAAEPTLEQQMDALLHPQKDGEEAATEGESEAESSGETVTVPAEDFKALLGIVQSTQDELSLVKSWIWGSVSLSGSPGEGESLWDVLRDMQAMVNETSGTTKDLSKALLKFAGWVAEDVESRLSEDMKKSAAEREAERLVGSQGNGGSSRRKQFVSSSIPDHAPGG